MIFLRSLAVVPSCPAPARVCTVVGHEAKLRIFIRNCLAWTGPGERSADFSRKAHVPLRPQRFPIEKEVPHCETDPGNTSTFLCTAVCLSPLNYALYFIPSRPVLSCVSCPVLRVLSKSCPAPL